MVALLLAAALASPVQHTIRVPQDQPTVQAGVNAAQPGDVVLLDRGTYKGAVDVPETKPGITIRGVDRNAVVFDGGNVRDDAIDVEADGVTLQNMSAHDFLKNGFYWHDVQGFTGSYLTVWNVYGYGIYSEGSTDGLVEHDYVSGAADAAYYVGECKPCRTTLRELVARRSAVGYSGTNASGGLVIRDSLWDRNGAGILPNTYANEEDPPQERATITGNTVTASGRARVPLHTPLAGFYGIGIGIAGGNANRVAGNTVTGSGRYGIAVFRTDYQIEFPPKPHPHGPWRPAANAIHGNGVRGSGIADLALSGTARAGNCFRANLAATSLPPRLQTRSCASPGGSATVAQALEAPLQSMLDRANRVLRPVDYKTVPRPGPQPNWPG
jgi:hypothetical protein